MTKSPMATLLKIDRRVVSRNATDAKHYATQIGEVVWAWNEVHSILQLLFSEVISPKNYEVGSAIWNSVKSDSGQRDLLAAAFRSTVDKTSPIFEGLEWLLDTVSTLARYRNDVTHVAGLLPRHKNAKFNPKMYADKTRAARLSSISDLRKFHRYLRDDLLVLGLFATALGLEMTETGKYGPLPARPEMRSLLQSATSSTRSNEHRQKHPKRAAKGR